jgi:5-aminopentanamidase
LSRRLRVAALEVPHRFGEVPVALAEIDRLLSETPGLDLALLPEAALTGYVSPRGDFDLAPFAEPLDGPQARALSGLAARHKIALAGPLIEREGPRCFNSLLLFDRAGQRVGHWRKRHPWFPERWAAPGELGTPVVALGGVKICAAICFDLHFIAAEAKDPLAEADVFLFPSAWVEEGRDSRMPLLGALARRFGLAVVNANWSRASRPALEGQGGSAILDRAGRLLARADPGLPSQAVCAELSLDAP